MKRLALDWTKHLHNPEDKANFEQLVRNSVQVLSRLQDVVKERQNTINANELLLADFDNPAWSFKQANRLGRKAAYKDMEDLLSFLKEG